MANQGRMDKVKVSKQIKVETTTTYTIEIGQEEFDVIYSLLANVNKASVKCMLGNPELFNIDLAKRMASALWRERFENTGSL